MSKSESVEGQESVHTVGGSTDYLYSATTHSTLQRVSGTKLFKLASCLTVTYKSLNNMDLKHSCYFYTSV